MAAVMVVVAAVAPDIVVDIAVFVLFCFVWFD